MKRLSLVVAMLFSAGTAAAATTPTHSTHHTTPKISRAEAEKTALAKVPGTVKTGELEHEHGKLVYSFDIARPGKSGVEEVMVDAHTGKVLSKSHETAKKEAGEKAKEEKAQTKSKTGY
jgi:uncharacterized membrane protein YkoI